MIIPGFQHDFPIVYGNATKINPYEKTWYSITHTFYLTKLCFLIFSQVNFLWEVKTEKTHEFYNKTTIALCNVVYS